MLTVKDYETLFSFLNSYSAQSKWDVGLSKCMEDSKSEKYKYVFLYKKINLCGKYYLKIPKLITKLLSMKKNKEHTK